LYEQNIERPSADGTPILQSDVAAWGAAKPREPVCEELREKIDGCWKRCGGGEGESAANKLNKLTSDDFVCGNPFGVAGGRTGSGGGAGAGGAMGKPEGEITGTTPPSGEHCCVDSPTRPIVAGVAAVIHNACEPADLATMNSILTGCYQSDTLTMANYMTNKCASGGGAGAAVPGDVPAQTSEGRTPLAAGEPELTATHTFKEKNMVDGVLMSTYELFIRGSPITFANVYVAYGDQYGDLLVPAAYKDETAAGVNTGGVHSALLMVLPESRKAPDSWLTVGRLTDAQITGGVIASIGIDWENWTHHGDGGTVQTDNGAVFWMNPDQGPKFGNPGKGAEPDGSILVGQITLPDDAVDEQRQVVMNFRGRSAARGIDKEADWAREGVTWNLPVICGPTCVPADVFTPRCGPEIQTNCCCD